MQHLWSCQNVGVLKSEEHHKHFTIGGIIGYVLGLISAVFSGLSYFK